MDRYTFESRESYEKAVKEEELIQQLKKKADLKNNKTVLKLYNKLVAEKTFSTVIGYDFLEELRTQILKSGLVSEELLPEIPVKVEEKKEQDTLPPKKNVSGKYKKLYENEKLKNKKLKIALVAALVLLAGFVIINFRFQYSIFTYFTNYKANMEEELIDKYENWQANLEQREQALGKGEDNQ